MDILKLFFTEKNDNYNKAKSSLKQIKRKFDGFVLSFPDVTPDEIMFIKEKWEELPKTIGKGVKIMAINLVDGCKSLITSYNPNSYITPHKHVNEFEYGLILKGSLTNRLTGIEYNVGDEYKFYPNEAHYLISKSNGCLVYSALSDDKDFKLAPLKKKILKKIDIN